MSFIAGDDTFYMFDHSTQQAGNKRENNSELPSFIEQPLMGQ